MTYANNKHMNDILTTCIEGGSAYWMNEEDDCRNVAITRNKEDLSVTEIFCETNVDGEEWKQHTITATEIRKALTKGKDSEDDYIKRVSKKLLDADSDWDANDADSALQLAIFGEIVFA